MNRKKEKIYIPLKFLLMMSSIILREQGINKINIKNLI